MFQFAAKKAKEFYLALADAPKLLLYFLPRVSFPIKIGINYTSLPGVIDI
jgi:dUTPase